VERIIFPDSCTLLDYMLATLTKLTEGLIVYPENMARNLDLSLGLWNSQSVLLALIKKGLTREAAYELVQRNAMKTWTAKHAGAADADFKQQLLSDPEVSKYLSRREMEELCNLDFHFREVKSKFQQVGL
jgi:adenylosuccinate lyase